MPLSPVEPSLAGLATRPPELRVHQLEFNSKLDSNSRLWSHELDSTRLDSRRRRRLLQCSSMAFASNLQPFRGLQPVLIDDPDGFPRFFDDGQGRCCRLKDGKCEFAGKSLPRGQHIERCSCDNLFHADCVADSFEGCGMCGTSWPAPAGATDKGFADLDHERKMTWTTS